MARKAREAISSAQAQPQAIPIATPVPNAGGDTVPALPDTLPPFYSASTIKRSLIVKPPLLVEGLLHRGCKMILAGGSKTFKSWTLLDLGLSVATGTPWWGSFRCPQPGVVVYLNFELIKPFLEERMCDISEAKQIALPDWFLVWNLRHHSYNLTHVADILRARIAAFDGRVDMIIVDPIYKAYGGLDENSATDMTALMNTVEDLSSKTGAAVVFGAHFSKGAQAQKESKDRISGSGVFGRDPDTILTMTKHRVEGSYTVEMDLRYLQPRRDFVISWRKPLMYEDEGLNPTDLWIPGPKQKEDKNEPFKDDDVLDCLVRTGAQDALWKDQVRQKLGRAGNPYYEAKKRLMDAGKVTKQGLKYLPTGFKLEKS